MKSPRAQFMLWQLGLTLFERKLLIKLSRARNGYIKKAADEYAKDGSVPAWLLLAHRLKLRGLLQEHYEAVIPYFGKLVLAQVKSRRISHKAAKNVFTSFMYEWIRTEALRKATMISQTDHGDVVNAIQKGIEAAEGIAAISKRIREVTALTTSRADTVARTETNNAANFGSIETARTAEDEFQIKLLKSWMPTLDARTRESHREMANKDPIPLNEQFNVGGESMDRPHDPSASADNVINCRCAQSYEEMQ